MRSVLRWLLPLLLACLVVVQVQRSSDLMRAQRLLYSVERRTMVMLRTGDLDKVKLRGNLQALADARELDPAEVAIPTLMGSQHLMLGELTEARKAYFTANRLESRPEIVLNLGKVAYSQRSMKRASYFFGLAVLLDPRMMKEVPEDFRDEVSEALRSQDDTYGADED